MAEERAGVGLFVGLIAAAAAAVVLASWLRPDETPLPEQTPAAFAPELEPAVYVSPPPEEKLRRDPAAAAKRFSRGSELYEEERFEEAQAEFEMAIELDPSQRDARFYLAWIYYRCGRYVEAEELLEGLIRASPWHGRARGLLEEVRAEHARMRRAPGGGDL